MIADPKTLLPAAAALLALALPAQEPAAEAWTAPDGSRFLFAPDSRESAPPVVHWVVVVPASLDEDPPGALGLSRAVLRASIHGTWTHGSRDPGAEERALVELDAAIAADWDVGTSTAGPSARLRAARERARELGDRGAWIRAVATAPATEPTLHEVPGASLLHVAAPASSLPQVAVLLLDWRENAALRGFAAERERVTSDLADIARSASGRLRREVLGTTYLGAAAARYVEGRGSHVSYDDAQRQRARLVQPRRSLHVLTGRFDPARMREVCAKVFERTTLPSSPAPEPLVAADVRARRSVIPSPDGEQGVLLAWSLPANASAMEIDALVDMLGGTPNSFLTWGLGRLGRIDLRIDAPFPPTARPGLLIVEATTRQDGLDAEQMETAIRDRLSSAAEKLHAGAVEAAARRAFARRVVETSDPRGLAFALAVGCGVLERTPTAVLPESAPSSGRLRELVEEIFQGAPVGVVSLAPAR